MPAICPAVSALPIMTDERHARLASIARTLRQHAQREVETCSKPFVQTPAHKAGVLVTSAPN